MTIITPLLILWAPLIVVGATHRSEGEGSSHQEISRFAIGYSHYRRLDSDPCFFVSPRRSILDERAGAANYFRLLLR